MTALRHLPLVALLAVLVGCGGTTVVGSAQPGGPVTGSTSQDSAVVGPGAATQESAAEEVTGDGTPVETSAEDAPLDETPVAEAPAEDPAADETPADETPADETPAEEAPVEESAPDSGAVTGSAVRYLAMGDSLTQGIGADDLDNGTFPALLAQRWRDAGCEDELKNVGISGSTAEQIVAEQVPEIQDYQPTVITFQGGGNDIATGVTIKTYQANIKTILDEAQAAGSRVMVFAQNEWYRSPEGQNYGGMALADQRAAYDQVLIDEAAAHGAQFVDLRPLYKEEADQNLWIEDGLHPTPQAYEDWAAAMAEAVPAPCN